MAESPLGISTQRKYPKLLCFFPGERVSDDGQTRRDDGAWGTLKEKNTGLNVSVKEKIVNYSKPKPYHMESTSTFLGLWDQSMIILAAGCLAIGLCTLLYYEFKVLQIKDFKEKHDFVNQHEIQYFWYVVVAFIAATAVYANSIATERIVLDGMRWFYVRLFITAGLGVVAYITCYSLVRIYYPRHLQRRLDRLRNSPRLSPEGNIMRKIAEAEEQHHLEENHLTGIHTIDYDIWIDDVTGHKKIEKYPAYQQAEECKECGYYTLRIDEEEIEHAPTFDDEGVLLSHYECTYCGHREQREIKVARLAAEAV